MNTITRIINVTFQIWGSVMSLILIFCMLVTGRNKTRIEKLYLGMISTNTLGLIMDALALYFRGKHGMFADFGVRATNLIEFVAGIVLSVHFFLYVQEYIESRTKKRFLLVYRHTVIGFALVGFAMIVLNLFQPFIYHIGADNLYVRDTYYPLIMVPSAVILTLSFYQIMKNRQVLDTWELFPFLVYIAAPCIGLIGSALVYGIVFAQIGTAIAMVIMFVFLQMEQSKRIVEKEKELAKKKIDISLSQIQPHFLYNVLGSIRSLCNRDPKLGGGYDYHLCRLFTDKPGQYGTGSTSPIHQRTPTCQSIFTTGKNAFW